MTTCDTTYIITGAAGHLGSTIIRQLIEKESHSEIRGLILPDEQPAVHADHIHYFEGNVCDISTMELLFQGCIPPNTIVIHTAALISIAGNVTKSLYEVNVRGVQNVIDLCRSHSVRRLIHVSSVHALPELPDRQTITEITDFSANAVIGAYAKTKAEGVSLVQNAINEGLDAVIIFPSGIIGPYDSGKNHIIQLAADYIKGRLPACVKGGYDFVDVRDVAEGCLKAAAIGRPGQGYILSGHYCTIQELLAMIGSVCGKKPVPCMPLWLAKAAAPLIESYAKITHTRALFTRYSLHTLTSNANFSNSKARKELNWKPREIEDTVRDMTQWLIQQAPDHFTDIGNRSCS